MSIFRERLDALRDARRVDPLGRRWLFVPYDQLTDAVGPLSRAAPRDLGIVLVECPAKAARRPYHKQKLALVLTSLRHFALEQADRGVAVRHVVAPSYAAALDSVRALGPLGVMRPAERELRAELSPMFESGALQCLPHEGWLTETEDFDAATRGATWRMDAFYRHVRRRLGVLMEGGKPVGGKLSFDQENRKPWRGEPSAPAVPTFPVDAITREVCALVSDSMGDHPGTLKPEALPASLADVEAAWAWAKSSCLPHFGPFEDAMSSRSRNLFHSRIAPLLNLQRLSAHRVLRDVVAMDLPVPSQEGFIRQVLGWREFVRHVHEATDGFRVVRGVTQPSGPDGGSRVSFLGAARPLPPAFWGKRSGLACLDEVVEGVWEDGTSHHITRLMVLSNIATILDVSPRELTDWFWAAYIDAYDWVVEPNVLGMGTFAAGDLMTTTPYVAGAAYIDRMSDYCEGCRFDPKTTCPLTPLYWAFLGRHRETLAGVDRMKLPMASERKRTAAQRASDAATLERVATALLRGEQLRASVRSGGDHGHA
ncbi:MAG: cryptochrome/photolyase family protein [Polyangiales bacterium]